MFHLCIKSKNYKKLLEFCKQDVQNLYLVLDYISTLEDVTLEQIIGNGFLVSQIDEYDRSVTNIEELIQNCNLLTNSINCKFESAFLIQTWLFSILSNPFDFQKNLSMDDKFKIENFLINFPNVEKLSLKILVKVYDLQYLIEKYCSWILINEYCKIYKLEDFFVQNIIFTLENFNELEILSEDRKNNQKLNNFFLENNDITSLIYKFKILSHQHKFYKIDINIFWKFLNFNNFKFGYSLCRSVLRLIKHFNKKEIIRYLESNLDSIFAKELLWINSFHILGSLQFEEDYTILDSKILESACFYEYDDTNYRSALVREYSIFYIYSIFRKRCDDYLINLLIFKCLFDSKYKIRQICCTILSSHFNIELLVKRHKDILDTYTKISKVYKFDILQFSNYICENVEIICIYKNIVHKYKLFKETERSIEYKENIFYFINCGYDIIYGFKYNNNFQHKLFLNLDLKSMYSYKYWNILVELYIQASNLLIKDLEDINLQHIIIKNIQFLINKNISDYKLYKLIWKIDSNILWDFMFRNRKKKNLDIVIANIRNEKYMQIIVNEYKQIIENGNIEHSILIYKSIKFYKNKNEFIIQIFKGLENYSVNYKGDVSYEIRLECLNLMHNLCKIENNTKPISLIQVKAIEDTNAFEFTELQKFNLINNFTCWKKCFNIFFIRYLVDKSKFIRDYLNTKINIYKEELCLPVSEYEFYKMISHSKKYDKNSVCIGFLGYFGASDNYKLDEILEAFISNIKIYDKCIRELINKKYTRVYDYILKLVIVLHEKGIREFIYEWAEMLKEFNKEKVEYILALNKDN